MSYEIYTDDNYDKEGNSQTHIATVDSLEKAVKICEDIVSKSLHSCAKPGEPAEKVYTSWHFGGATAFIRGSNSFDPDEYAKKVAFENYHSFDINFHKEVLRQRICESINTFRQNNDSSESIDGGLSIRGCREEAQNHAISALNQQALTLEVYENKVISMLDEVLLDFQENTFGGSALIAALLREYMIPAVRAYFAELDLH